jgi:phosphatidylethanolamine/phosphatidyl-N-methylethanolamine N-methyltransferase
MPAVYDSLAKIYDPAFAPFERLFLSKWRAETLAMLPADGTILEVGCGTGANFQYYPQKSHAVSSELSIEMLQFAKQKLIGNRLVQADAESLPFVDDGFDAAFATLVFCSIPDPKKAFWELSRVVKPGGKLILLEHVRPPGFLGRVFDAVSKVTESLINDHFNRRTAEIAESSGWKVTRLDEKAARAVNLIVCENKKGDS